MLSRPAEARAGSILSAAAQAQVARRRDLATALAMLLIVTAVAALASLTAPEPFSVAFVALVVVCAVAVARPSVGLLAVVMLALLGDNTTAWWYPFTKNLSSQESILFVSDRFPISPLEIVLFVTTAAWLLSALGDPNWRFRAGRLLVPVLVFTCFAVVGLLYGYVRGGDVNVALWEARPLFYLPVVYVLVTNLITDDRGRIQLMVVAMGGIAVQALLSLHYYWRVLTPDQRDGLERLTDHAAAIHQNAFFVFVLALVLLRATPLRYRLAASAAAVPVGISWVLSQRRAAAIALLLGMALLSLVLLWRNRRAALWFVPLFGLGLTAYLAAFWNVEDGAGFVAQAVKSVIAPETVSARHASSNLYRELETFNVWFTIRQHRLTGVGFGQPFYRPLPLADISVFPFWEFMPHNSMLWIYLKTGFLGFASMLFVLARTIQRGTVTALTAGGAAMTAVTTTALSYVLMYVVYAYVDIAWDIRSTLFLAVTAAICADSFNSQGTARDAVLGTAEVRANEPSAR